MTKNHKKTVRKEAESAIKSIRIPTFDEVYTMPHVQESIRSLIDLNIHQFPVLASYADDIRQELLIALNKALPNYDGRAGIKTFCRTCLENSIASIRRRYHRKQDLVLSYATDISDYDDDLEEKGLPPEDVRAFVSQCRNTVEDDMLRMDINDAIHRLPKQTRVILEKLLDGESMTQIENSMQLSHSTIRRKHLDVIKKELFGTIF